MLHMSFVLLLSYLIKANFQLVEITLCCGHRYLLFNNVIPQKGYILRTFTPVLFNQSLKRSNISVAYDRPTSTFLPYFLRIVLYEVFYDVVHCHPAQIHRLRDVFFASLLLSSKTQ